MGRGGFCVLLAGFALIGQVKAQDVFVDSDETARAAAAKLKKQAAAREQPFAAIPPRESFPKAKPVLAKNPLVTPATLKVKPISVPAPKIEAVKAQPAVIVHTIKAPTGLAQNSKTATASAGLPLARNMRLTKVEGPAAEPATQLPFSEDSSSSSRGSAETAFVRLADGFDFPVGRPDAQGYYKARGFRSHGHLGEDWDGIRGGDTDLGDPIYCIGNGIVVFARDCHMGWGNVVIVRHSYREGGTVKNIDSLYGHLNTILVRRGQAVGRGQKIATMGTAHGLYDAHLHLEIRKNIEIGMSRSAFAQDYSNYYDPSQFITSHRRLQNNGGTYKVAMNTFVRDGQINFAALHNYSHSHYHGGTHESSVALKKAVATTKNE